MWKKQKQQKKPKQAIKKKVVPVKEKSEEHILKKNTGVKILRGIFWIMLIFFFVKGVAITLQPDDSEVVKQTITNFQKNFDSYKDDNEEINGFAENFAKEYLTYTQKGDKDYKERIEPYVTTKIYNNSLLLDFKGTARTVYAKAYRKENYSDNQYDVYVLAEVAYQIEEIDTEEKENKEEVDEQNVPEETETQEIEVSSEESDLTQEKEIVVPQTKPQTETKKEKSYQTVYEQTTLRIPVSKDQEGNYIIEDVPMFVADSIKSENYTLEEYQGTNVSDEVLKDVSVSLNNFLKAYYEQDQSVIDYYVSKNADKKNFESLSGRYQFGKIESIKCYQEVGQDIVCVISFRIKDSVNNVIMLQEMNLVMESEGNQYYVLDMNARIGNLNFNS